MTARGAPRRLLAVAGTRPEAIKLAPLLLGARDRAELHFTLVGTGQHRAPFTDALAAFGLAADEQLALACPGQSVAALGHAVEHAMPALLAAHAPDMVVVQGDTTSAWAAGLAAHRLGVPVAHVEAGLRSGDPRTPWPEERNRQELDGVASLLFAPTCVAAANLAREGVAGRVLVTGNSGVDALHLLRPAAIPRDPQLRHLLVTCHRRESLGAPLVGLAEALRTLARLPGVRVNVALHPNPAAGPALAGLLADTAGVALLPPQPYPAMVALLAQATLVLSDSGGIQEECAALGTPILVLRDRTERPEALAAGNARLVGLSPRRIVAMATELLADPAALAAMARPSACFGRGDAARRMLAALAQVPLPA